MLKRKLYARGRGGKGNEFSSFGRGGIKISAQARLLIMEPKNGIFVIQRYVIEGKIYVP